MRSLSVTIIKLLAWTSFWTKNVVGGDLRRLNNCNEAIEHNDDSSNFVSHVIVLLKMRRIQIYQIADA